MITVVNCHYQTPDIYCGRAYKGYKRSPLANDNIDGKHGTLVEVVDLFALDLWKKIKARDRDVLNELRTILDLENSKGLITLGCWHNSRPCHVERIIAALRSERVIGILNELMPF